MTEQPPGVNVNIDAAKVIDKLARRIAELEVTVAQQTAVIAALLDEKEANDKQEGGYA